MVISSNEGWGAALPYAAISEEVRDLFRAAGTLLSWQETRDAAHILPPAGGLFAVRLEGHDQFAVDNTRRISAGQWAGKWVLGNRIYFPVRNAPRMEDRRYAVMDLSRIDGTPDPDAPLQLLLDPFLIRNRVGFNELGGADPSIIEPQQITTA